MDQKVSAKYTERFNEAKQALSENGVLSEQFDEQELLNAVGAAIKKQVEQETMPATIEELDPDNADAGAGEAVFSVAGIVNAEVEAWDMLNYNTGRDAAEAYARVLGIDDDKILGLIKEVGYHYAVLFIETKLDHLRESSASTAATMRESGMDGTVGGGYGFVTWDNYDEDEEEFL